MKGKGQGGGTETDKDITPEEWQKIWDVNILGYIKCIEHALPFMKKNPLTKVFHTDEQNLGKNFNCGSRGSIINLASVAGLIAGPEFLSYCTSKAANHHLSRCMAVDLAEYPIRVNAVSPGDAWTQAQDNVMDYTGLSREEATKNVEGTIPLERLCAPAEIANIVRFFASDEASFLTGINIVADGGRTIKA